MPNPVTRYFERVDRALSGATEEQKIALIETETRKWRNRFTEFQGIVDSGQPIPDRYAGATSYDFHETFAGLSARLPKKEAA